MTANAQQTYRALLDKEICHRAPSPDSQAGMLEEIKRLSKRRRSERELLLLSRYRRALGFTDKLRKKLA
jgi:hypothetical protein